MRTIAEFELERLFGSAYLQHSFPVYARPSRLLQTLMLRSLPRAVSKRQRSKGKSRTSRPYLWTDVARRQFLKILPSSSASAAQPENFALRMTEPDGNSWCRQSQLYIVVPGRSSGSKIAV